MDRALTGTTNPGQSLPEINDNQEILLKSPELEPQRQMQFSVIPKTLFLWGGGLTPSAQDNSVF